MMYFDSIMSTLMERDQIIKNKVDETFLEKYETFLEKHETFSDNTLPYTF